MISFEHIDTVDLDDNAEIISKGKTVTDGILGKEWLNSDHMSAVNKLMIEARYSVHGFQETTLAPVLKKDGTWHIPSNGFESKNSPSVNLHYNGNKHWVTSFEFENGDIYLLDSYLGTNMKDSLNDSLKIQLAQIYGYGKLKLNVKFPCVQQQHNSYDCGLFAIANMMEFATNRYSGLTDAHLKFSYVQKEMRVAFTEM